MKVLFLAMALISSTTFAETVKNIGDNYGMPAGGRVFHRAARGFGSDARNSNIGDNYGMPTGGSVPFVQTPNGPESCPRVNQIGDNYGLPGYCL